MNRLWMILITSSVIAAIAEGRTGETAEAILRSGDEAVGLMITLLASITLWSGLISILEASGDVERLGRVLRRIARGVFPHLDDDCWSAMSLNFSANMLGLGNAATPAGIEAAQRMAAHGAEGMKALAMLLVINNGSIQLMPTTVIAMRQAAGSADPAGMWGMTLLVSAATTVSGIVLMRLWQGRKQDGRDIRNGNCLHCGTDCCQRKSEKV